MKKYSLIVPIIRQQKNNVPDEFLINPQTGKFNFFNNIIGLPFDYISDIYIVYLTEHRKYINNELNPFDIFPCNIHFLELHKSTRYEPETIYKTIEHFNIKGPIIIKDSDHYFSYSGELNGNGVFIYSLEDMNTPIMPKEYSYVNIDDNMLITNIIEKRIISNMFNCGGYIFEDVNDFIDAYKHLANTRDKIYISHIIYYLMLNKDLKFKGIKADLYKE